MREISQHRTCDVQRDHEPVYLVIERCQSSVCFGILLDLGLNSGIRRSHFLAQGNEQWWLVQACLYHYRDFMECQHDRHDHFLGHPLAIDLGIQGPCGCRHIFIPSMVHGHYPCNPMDHHRCWPLDDWHGPRKVTHLDCIRDDLPMLHGCQLARSHDGWSTRCTGSAK